ncbi:hypothetical protein ES703_117700 [subsurface metagenome]
MLNAAITFCAVEAPIFLIMVRKRIVSPLSGIPLLLASESLIVLPQYVRYISVVITGIVVSYGKTLLPVTVRFISPGIRFSK